MYPSITKDDNVRALKSSAQNIGNEARQTAAESKEDLQEAANKVGQRVRSFVEDAKNEISHATDNVTHQINEKPVQSALIALGAGFILGMLFRR